MLIISTAKFCENKKIDENKNIDLKLLKEKKIISKKFEKLKILGSGELKKKFNITANFASKQAQAKIEKAGGKLNLTKK